MGRGRAIRDDARMQVIAVSNSSSLADRVAVARSIAVAVLLARWRASPSWLALPRHAARGELHPLRPAERDPGRRRRSWSGASRSSCPASFLIMGVVRLASVAGAVAASRPQARDARTSPGRWAPITWPRPTCVLPGGRRVHEMVLGPFGIVVLGDVPPPSVTRHVGARWEIRDEPRPLDPDRGPGPARQPRRRARPGLARGRRPRLPRPRLRRHRDRRRDHRALSRRAPSWRPSELAGWLEALPAAARPDAPAPRAPRGAWSGPRRRRRRARRRLTVRGW